MDGMAFYQMIADAVLLIGLTYVERRAKEETEKLQEVEAEHAVQEKEMNKAAKQGQTNAIRETSRVKQHGKKLNVNGHKKPQKHYNIQQPSKRD